MIRGLWCGGVCVCYCMRHISLLCQGLISIIPYAVVPFDVHRAVHRNIISIVNPTRCTNYQFYFILEWHSTCFGRSLVHHQEFKAVHTATGICQTVAAEYPLASRQISIPRRDSNPQSNRACGRRLRLIALGNRDRPDFNNRLTTLRTVCHCM